MIGKNWEIHSCWIASPDQSQEVTRWGLIGRERRSYYGLRVIGLFVWITALFMDDCLMLGGMIRLI